MYVQVAAVEVATSTLKPSLLVEFMNNRRMAHVLTSAKTLAFVHRSVFRKAVTVFE